MALTPTASAAGSTARTQFTIWSQSAGNGGAVYTVPAGKIFIGYVYPKYPNQSTYWNFTVNGIVIEMSVWSSADLWSPIPIYLGEGDVISNNSTYYFGLTGYEE